MPTPRRRTAVALLSLVPVLHSACGDDGGTDLAAFCEANATINSDDPFSATSPESAETVAGEMRDALAQGRDAAPDEISSDVERVAGVFEGMLDELEAARFDTSAVSAEELFAEASVDDPEFEPALQRVGEFAGAECDP